MFAYPDFTIDFSLYSHSPLVFVVIVGSLQAWVCRVSTPAEYTPDMCIAAGSKQPKLGTSLLMITVSRAQGARLVLWCMITLSILLSTGKLSRSVLCPARLNVRNF